MNEKEHHTPLGIKWQFKIDVPGTVESAIPVTHIHGHKKGPHVLVTAGVHGGEYPGIAASMELAEQLTPDDISGTLTIVHIVNIGSFWERTSEIHPEDRKNLNRVFPGDPEGTITEKIAWTLLNDYIKTADYYIDLHSGDIHEDLLAHVYYSKKCKDEVSHASKEMADVVDVPYMIPSQASGGAYNCAALNGVPCILLEHGCGGLCGVDDVQAHKGDVVRILRHLGLLEDTAFPEFKPASGPKETGKVTYYNAAEDCCWRPQIQSGDRVKKGDLVGYATDLYGRRIREYHAEDDGVALCVGTSLAMKKDGVLAFIANVD